MKVQAFKIYAAPVALLLMAGGLSAPSASAETHRNARVVQTTFAYDRTAPAVEIYADLERTVQRLCRNKGAHPSYMRRYDRGCIDSAMSNAIGQIGRVDIAQLHTRLGG